MVRMEINKVVSKVVNKVVNKAVSNAVRTIFNAIKALGYTTWHFFLLQK